MRFGASAHGLAVWLTLPLVLAGPAAATAQKDAFVDAFITFHSALAGAYGDEGPAAAAALERMAVGLEAWERATAADEAALKQRPNATAAELALLYADAQRLDDAADAMKAAAASEPARAPLFVFTGLLHEEAGRIDVARAAYQAAQQLDGADPISAYLLADARARRGDGGVAPLAVVLERASERGRLGRTAFYQFRLIEDRSSKTPVFAPSAYAAGFALIEQRRYREAIATNRAVAQRDPLMSDVAARDSAVLKGIAALRAKDGSTAVAQLAAAVAAHPGSSEVHRVLGVVYRAVGRLPDSIEHFTIAARLDPANERARVALGGTLAEAGRGEDAARVLRETIAALPASGEARWALADLLQAGDRGAEAMEVLEEAAALTVVAGKAQLYWRIAELAQAYRRDYPRVISALARRVRLIRNDGDAHKNLGLAYLRPGRDDEALVELQMALLLGVEDAETITAMGQAQLNSGRFEQAEPLLRRAIGLDPTSAQAHYALGMTLRRLGRTDEARKRLAEFERLRATAFDEQRRTFESAR
jgi:tetratricopeptide (TPR) repeat protein